MAWRIEQFIIRGELDNTQPGKVIGTLWLSGLSDPVRLHLEGNPWQDLAGCHLVFENPSPLSAEGLDLDRFQHGLVGDITASRKIRIDNASTPSLADIPLFPLQGKALYIEWFSTSNGRVVIESTRFNISLSPPTWEMTTLEHEAQIKRNVETASEWLRSEEFESDDEESWLDEPMDEFEWERFLKESDTLSEKYEAALEKYKNDPECDRLVAREMGWSWLEGEDDAPLEEEDFESLDTMDPNPLTEGVDWVRDEYGMVHHPLTSRAHKFATMLWKQVDEMGLLGGDNHESIELMVIQTQTLSTKLAGALDHLAYEQEQEPGFVVACLKRALGFLHEALTGITQVQERGIMPPEHLQSYRKTLFELRENILHLMKDFRSRQR